MYAGQGQDEYSPDQFQNELPPRGDISQYRAEQPDQFYHELPRGQYTNDPNRPPQTFNVYSRSNGDPTERTPYNGEEQAEVVEIEPKGRNFTNKQNGTYGNDQQARLIELYTGNGGVSEVGQVDDQTNSRYTSNNNNNYNNNNRNGQYQDVGNVRARVVSVTPPPATALPVETVNRRRIVVSKPVTTVQEVVEADNSNNSTGDAQNGNYRSNYVDQRNDNRENSNNADGRYRSNFESNGNYGSGSYNQNQQNNNNNNYNNGRYNSEYSGNYRSESNYNANGNNDYDRNQNNQRGSQSKNGKYEESGSSTGVYISTTPSSASQRIIYVQPVSQDFAQQKAVAPKNN